MRIGWKNALVLGLSLVGTLLAVEAALRVLTSATFPQQPFPNIDFLRLDPVSGWRNAAGLHADSVEVAGFRYAARLDVDSRGFHGAEIAPDKTPGSLRIACLGDSGTFGFWRHNETITVR